MAPPKTRLPPTTILPVLIRKPQVPPYLTFVTPPFSLQLIPPILIVPKITTPSIFCIQDLNLVMNNRIVQCFCEQSPPQSPLTTDNPMDVA